MIKFSLNYCFQNIICCKIELFPAFILGIQDLINYLFIHFQVKREKTSNIKGWIGSEFVQFEVPQMDASSLSSVIFPSKSIDAHWYYIFFCLTYNLSFYLLPSVFSQKVHSVLKWRACVLSRRFQMLNVIWYILNLISSSVHLIVPIFVLWLVQAILDWPIVTGLLLQTLYDIPVVKRSYKWLEFGTFKRKKKISWGEVI